MCNLFQVFARVAPDQKELVLTTFKTVGRMTLMCGDGTNDVGALKQVKQPPHSLSISVIYSSNKTYVLYMFLITTQAHVGIALLNAEPTAQKKEDEASKDSKSESKAGKSKKPKAGESSSQPLLPPTANSSAAGPSTNRRMTAADKQREKLKKMLEEMNNDEGDGRSAPVVKLGDASMASPFTAKHASVAPTLDIIRQGRSTLVTTLQMFKILGLNCLATAYVLSVMYLDGVKLGDVQVLAN